MGVAVCVCTCVYRDMCACVGGWGGSNVFVEILTAIFATKILCFVLSFSLEHKLHSTHAIKKKKYITQDPP